MPELYIANIKIGTAPFKLLDTFIELRGTGTLLTYQNIGDIVATIQGSNDNVNWTTLRVIDPSGSKVVFESWKYLRQLEPLANVLVTRGLD